MNEIVFTDEQKYIFESIVNTKQGNILVTGSAGTGKTFLIGQLIKYYNSKNKNILCLSPTHQAKKQIKNTLSSYDDINKVYFKTVASFLNVQLKYDSITGKATFTEGSGNTSVDNDIIMVDESSMVTESQVSKIIQSAKDKLVIFFGDFNQLPPISGNNGSKFFSKMEHYELTNIVRNQGEILELCNQLKDKIVKPTINNKNIFKLGNIADTVNNLYGNIVSNSDPEYNCYLSFTKYKTRYVRNMIHKKLYGTAEFVIGQYIKLDSIVSGGSIGDIYVIKDLEKIQLVILDGIVKNAYKLVIENVHEAGNIDTIFALSYTDQDEMEEKLSILYNEAKTKYYEAKKIKDEDDPERIRLNHEWSYIITMVQSTHNITLISSPYSSTVHKSQGRTIDNVFIDMSDIMKYGRNITKNLLYVASSRSKSTITFV